MQVDTHGEEIDVGKLRLLQVRAKEKKRPENEGSFVAAQVYHKGELLSESEVFKGKVRLRAFANVSLDKGGSTILGIVDFAQGRIPRCCSLLILVRLAISVQ